MLKKNKPPLNPSFCAIIVLFLAVLSSGCATSTTSALATSSSDPIIVQLKPRTFALNTYVQALLKLNGDVCQVQVQPGNGSSIGVQVAIRHYRNNPMPAINYSQNSAKSIVAINEKLAPQISANESNDSVAINITVPRHINLFLSTNVGDLAVAGVSGQFALATSTGNISVVNAQLTKRSSLVANVGNVFFSGALTPQGTYNMEARVGRIDLTFQRPPSLQMNAQTMIGSIHSDFPNITVNSNLAQGTLGQPPYAHLSLTTHVGSISLLSQ